jgi:UDP-glucose 4-epimerase
METNLLDFNRVLLVGGGGFIGRNLMHKLISIDVPVACFDRERPAWLPDGVRFFEGDFTSAKDMEPAVAESDAVVHLASTVLPKKSNEDPAYDIDSNLKASVRLLKLSAEYRVKRFIFISSGGTVYGPPMEIPIRESHPTNPICSYGIVKLAIEKYLRLFEHLNGLCGCSLRLANPYGAFQRHDTGQGVIAAFCHKALAGEQIEIWGDGNIARDFVYIDDVTEAIWRVVGDATVTGELNIGSGMSTTLNQVVDCIETIIGKPLPCVYHDARSFDVQESRLDISKARKELSWEPLIPLEDGIRMTIDWQRLQVSAR